MKDIFPGYQMIIAPSSDDARAKWDAVKDEKVDIIVGGGLSLNDISWSSISSMNKAVNSHVLYVPDQSDTWQNPVMTFEHKTGDCEDYAILKRAILAQHLPTSQTALVLGEIASLAGNQQHAFLIVELADERRVLDNKFDQIIEPQDYINWIPKKLLTDDDVFLFGRQFSIAETAE